MSGGGGGEGCGCAMRWWLAVVAITGLGLRERPVWWEGWGEQIPGGGSEGGEGRREASGEASREEVTEGQRREGE